MAVIVVALDGSSFAEQALSQVRSCLGPSDELVFVRVVEVPVTGTTLPWIEAHVKQAQHYLRQLALTFEPEVPVSCVVRTGSPKRELLRVLEERQASLLLMTSHGRSGVQRLVLGSVAEQVLRRANCPVWLVRTQASDEDSGPAVNRVMVALDTSTLAEKGLEFARAWLGGTHTQFILCAATDLEPELWEGVADGPEARARVVSALYDYLRSQAEPLRAQGWSCHLHVEDAPAVPGILAVARREKVDLLVMATHGRTGPERWALGSVAERVLRQAECDVALVNAHAIAAPGESESELIGSR